MNLQLNYNIHNLFFVIDSKVFFNNFFKIIFNTHFLMYIMMFT